MSERVKKGRTETAIKRQTEEENVKGKEKKRESVRGREGEGDTGRTVSANPPQRGSDSQTLEEFPQLEK